MRNHRMKKSAMEEVINTEISYQEGLNWMITWRNLLLVENIITDEEANKLFCNVRDIMNLSKMFLQLWKQKFNVWTSNITVGKQYFNKNRRCFQTSCSLFQDLQKLLNK